MSKLDEKKIDDAVLALLFLGCVEDGSRFRAWKSHDWDALARLHEAGFIENPVGKAKSVAFTSEGMTRSKQLLHELFGRNENEPA